MVSKAEKTIKKLLLKADVEINGTHPWDIHIHNDNLYNCLIAQGSLGLGESYMDGWWDVDQLDEFFNKILRINLKKELGLNTPLILNYLQGKIFNLQKKSRAFEIGKRHYDIGDDLYKLMLDKRLTYSCGYWKNAKTLDEAQEAKLDLICKKLNLKKGQKVLDIGSGWGSFIKYASENYGVECVGITVSKGQMNYANKNSEGLPIETRLQDYMDIFDTFDHIVSVGMFEHVGQKNYKKFMKKVHSLLNDDGLFLLHTIGSSISIPTTDPWIRKYIFPNSMLPSIKQISKSVENLIEGLYVMEDWHNFGADYDLTLMEWYKNFDKNWDKLKDKYEERFYRMWKYYLLSSAGAFRSRKNQLWQIVLSKKGIIGGYKPIR